MPQLVQAPKLVAWANPFVCIRIVMTATPHVALPLPNGPLSLRKSLEGPMPGYPYPFPGPDVCVWKRDFYIAWPCDLRGSEGLAARPSVGGVNG